MLARCTACRTTFRAERFGRQACPHCGAEVEIREPTHVAEATPQVSPPPEGAPPPHAPYVPPPAQQVPMPDGWTPWERRAELGFWPALGLTLKGTLFEPNHFFSSMRYDRAVDAHLYFLVVAVAPQLLMGLFGLFTPAGESTEASMDALRQLGQLGTLDPSLVGRIETLAKLLTGTGAQLTGLATTPVTAYLQLYLFAGMSHLVLLALGKAQGGWAATFKAFVYAYGAGVLWLVPGCGGLLVLTWASALEMLGLARGHRTSITIGGVAVIGWHLALATCACLVIGAVFGATSMLVGGR
jgi:hypothetical protein